jgi:mRNA interferase MazF
MPSFEAWDVVAVPFPYTDKSTRQRRPALVVSAGPLLEMHGLLWVLMITSAENRTWPDDVAISDLISAGLPAPSVVRTAKIATIESKDAVKLGAVATQVREGVSLALNRRLSARRS